MIEISVLLFLFIFFLALGAGYARGKMDGIDKGIEIIRGIKLQGGYQPSRSDLSELHPPNGGTNVQHK